MLISFPFISSLHFKLLCFWSQFDWHHHPKIISSARPQPSIQVRLRARERVEFCFQTCHKITSAQQMATFCDETMAVVMGLCFCLGGMMER